MKTIILSISVFVATLGAKYILIALGYQDPLGDGVRGVAAYVLVALLMICAIYFTFMRLWKTNSR